MCKMVSLYGLIMAKFFNFPDKLKSSTKATENKAKKYSV